MFQDMLSRRAIHWTLYCPNHNVSMVTTKLLRKKMI